jgi:hypothetical protein
MWWQKLTWPFQKKSFSYQKDYKNIDTTCTTLRIYNPHFFLSWNFIILIFNIVCCEKTNFFPIIWNNLNVLRTKDIIITGNITTISPWIVSQDLELKYHNSSVVYYVVFVTLDVLSSVFDNCSLFPLV